MCVARRCGERKRAGVFLCVCECCGGRDRCACVTGNKLGHQEHISSFIMFSTYFYLFPCSNFLFSTPKVTGHFRIVMFSPVSTFFLVTNFSFQHARSLDRHILTSLRFSPVSIFSFDINSSFQHPVKLSHSEDSQNIRANKNTTRVKHKTLIEIFTEDTVCV